jgi:uncharacterized protein YndB with AHSA1/START domain
MMILVNILLLILAVVAVAGLIGLLLPRTHVTRQAARVGRKPEEVYRVLTDYQNLPAWHPDVERVEAIRADPEWLEWRQVLSSGLEGHMRQIAAAPPHRIAWEFAEPHGAVRGRWEAEVTPEAAHARVDIRQYADVRNPYARVLAYVAGRNEPLKLYLGALRTHLEQEAPGKPG